jgi:hypothetical protein
MSNQAPEVYTLRVTKAQNGWIVQTAGSIGDFMSAAILVPTGESLGDSIAAAIVGHKLTTDDDVNTQAMKDHYEKLRNSMNIVHPPFVSGSGAITASGYTTATGLEIQKAQQDKTSLFGKILNRVYP